MISADASHGLAETLEGSRKSWDFDPLLPTVGLIVLGAFVVLYCVNTVLYQTVLRFWVGDPWSYPFLDLMSHLSHIECFSKGEDVYVTNTCDPLALTHTPPRFNYSPLWLRLPSLAVIKAFMPVSGLCLAVVFLLALGFVPQPLGIKARAVSVLGLLSGAVVFCIERENVDIVMFLLALAGGLCLGKRLIVRYAGYGLFITAALLKFYPAVLLSVAVRERPRVAIALAAAVAGISVVFIGAFHEELSRALANVPSGSAFGDMWGAVILPAGVNEFLPDAFGVLGYDAAWIENLRRSHLVAVILYISLVPMSLVFAIGMTSVRAIRTAASLPLRVYLFLVLGGAVVSACFMLEPNAGYRGVWLLFVLPGTLILGEIGSARRLFNWTAAATLLVMWSTPIRRIIGFVSGMDSSPGRMQVPQILEWFVEQLAWWFLATVLLAVVFRFAMDGLPRWWHTSSLRGSGRIAPSPPLVPFGKNLPCVNPPHGK